MILGGSPWKGLITMSIAAGSAMLLIWNGAYLKDPRSAGEAFTLLQQTVAAAVILLTWLITVRTRKRREQINYRILPQDLRVEKPEPRRQPQRISESFEIEDIPDETPEPEAAPPQNERRRFTDEDNKARDAFKEYLETL
jgi:hypothetical protein